MDGRSIAVRWIDKDGAAHEKTLPVPPEDPGTRR